MQRAEMGARGATMSGGTAKSSPSLSLSPSPSLSPLATKGREGGVVAVPTGRVPAATAPSPLGSEAREGGVVAVPSAWRPAATAPPPAAAATGRLPAPTAAAEPPTPPPPRVNARNGGRRHAAVTADAQLDGRAGLDLEVRQRALPVWELRTVEADAHHVEDLCLHCVDVVMRLNA